MHVIDITGIYKSAAVERHSFIFKKVDIDFKKERKLEGIVRVQISITERLLFTRVILAINFNTAAKYL